MSDRKLQTLRTLRIKSRRRRHQREWRKVQRQQQLRVVELVLDKLEKKQQSTLRCLNNVIEAVLCQIFSFLEVHEHWKFSRTSVKMAKISRSWQASPVKINLLHILAPLSFADERIIAKLLLNFQPRHLTIPSNIPVGWFKMEKMTNLRELTIDKNAIANGHTYSTIDLRWLCKLIHLEKLEMPGEKFVDGLTFPTSLTYLEFSGRSGGFATFGTASFFQLTYLVNLRVLKLPNDYYYEMRMLKIGQVFPELRELSFGYLRVSNRALVSFTDLQSCQHLESLSIGVDSEESIMQWSTLTPANGFACLRHLSISIYRNYNYPNLFAGLAQLVQLTHLKLAPYRGRMEVDISKAILELTTIDESKSLQPIPTSDSESSSAPTEPKVVLPRLTTLLIADGLVVSDSSWLESFASLTELGLPGHRGCPPIDVRHLPRLRTLHLSSDQEVDCVLSPCKDQLTTVFYENHSKIVDSGTNAVLDLLKQMKQLTTLKLNSFCKYDYDGYGSVFDYFKLNLPRTVSVEIDSLTA